jgi:hypothetical protein
MVIYLLATQEVPCLVFTVTSQRIELSDLSSLTERTIPVTGKPFKVNVAV